MKSLVKNNSSYEEQITFINTLQGNYNNSVIFHCYWNGNLNEKHLISIRSCYYFNINNNVNNKIILWLENNHSNNFNLLISEYCEIKLFDITNQVKNTFLEDKEILYIGGSAGGLSEKANFYRLVLLYNYGGCWFDLDMFFLKSFEPIFNTFQNAILMYQWEKQNYPNNGIVISLEKKSETLKSIIQYIIDRKKGWGFQRAKLTYNLPMQITVLPCATFDPGWINTEFSKKEKWTEIFFNKTVHKNISIESFYKDCFSYHWHNRWNLTIHNDSLIKNFDNEIIERLNKNI